VGPFEMVVIIVFLGTLGKLGQPVARALASRFSRPAGAVDAAQVQALRSALGATEDRLAQAEDRITELDEKLRFVEGLLEKPVAAPTLPPSPR
jgi:hypothetical protein